MILVPAGPDVGVMVRVSAGGSCAPTGPANRTAEVANPVAARSAARVRFIVCCPPVNGSKAGSKSLARPVRNCCEPPVTASHLVFVLAAKDARRDLRQAPFSRPDGV